MAKTTMLDTTHTFEEFGFRPLFAQQQQRTGKLNLLSGAIPGRAGAWDFGTEVGTKTFSVPLVMIEVDDILKEEKIDNLLAFFLNQRGEPRYVKINFRRAPDKYITAKLVEVQDSDYTNQSATLTLNFEALDPFRYAQSDMYDLPNPLTYDSGAVYGAKSYANTTQMDWLYNINYAGIHNYSSLATPIKLTITGTIAGGTVTHLETGTKMTLPDITAGTIIIDSNNYTVTVNGVDTIFSGEFFELSAGDNGFEFDAESVSGGTTVMFEWEHRFN